MKKILLSARGFISLLTLVFSIGTNQGLKAQVTCTQTETFKPYAYNTPPSNWRVHVSAAEQFRESTSPAPNSRTAVLEIRSKKTNSRPYVDPGHVENLQGGIYNLKNQNVVVLKAEVYISPDFMNQRRRTDMWGIARGDDFTVYGELAFRNVDGKSPGFFYWDGKNNFHPANIKVMSGKWYLLEMRLSERKIEYYVDGKYVGKLSTNNFIFNFKQLAFHNYNFNDPALPKKQYDPASTYSSYWDNPQALCGSSCGPDEVILYRDCIPECVRTKDKEKKLQDERYSETPCPPTNNNNAATTSGSMRSAGGEDLDKTTNASTNIPKLIVSNYPNPFAGRTTIQYQIPEPGKVSLVVYDVLGRPITTLVDAQKPQGTFRVDFNASKISKGNYFYRIIVNTNSNKILTTTGNMNVLSQ